MVRLVLHREQKLAAGSASFSVHAEAAVTRLPTGPLDCAGAVRAGIALPREPKPPADRRLGFAPGFPAASNSGPPQPAGRLLALG